MLRCCVGSGRDDGRDTESHSDRPWWRKKEVCDCHAKARPRIHLFQSSALQAAGALFFPRSKFYTLIYLYIHIHAYHHIIKTEAVQSLHPVQFAARARASSRSPPPHTNPPRLRPSSASCRTLPVGALRLTGHCAWCWRLLRAVTATHSQSRESVQNGAGA